MVSPPPKVPPSDGSQLAEVQLTALIWRELFADVLAIVTENEPSQAAEKSLVVRDIEPVLFLVKDLVSL